MIPISKPVIGQEEIDAVVDVLKSGYVVQGQRVRQFEEKFAALYGFEHAVAVSSGTAALWLALMLHGIGQDDEVITTPFTFVATANTILYTGGRPVFADIKPDTYNLDPADVAAKITPKTKAIVAVHLYGQVCDMDQLQELADAHNLVLIEDACQAHGAQLNGKSAGSFATGCFSFYATKNMTTVEGGMLTTSDASLAERARLLRNHGQQNRYHYAELGYHFRMTDLQAALGLVQLDKIEAWTERRIANASYLSSHIETLPPPFVKSNARHVYHQYTVRVGERRDAVREQLAEAGVRTETYYPIPLHQQPLYRNLGYDDTLPQAERASREVLSLPVHASLAQSELEQIVEAANRIA
ncbi:MAG: DegT/DnrJ/EryC1/StrS family aminotransferase [Anaerolineae bacterium]